MREECKEKLQDIFDKVADKTLKTLNKEKGNHISKKTEKMITLCMALANYF